MVKFLICGDVKEGLPEFLQKLNALNHSQHGPFNVCFCLGGMFADSIEFESLRLSLNIPIPTYLLDPHGIPFGADLPVNLHILEAQGIQTIEKLTVAYCRDQDDVETSSEHNNIKNVCESKAYRGCDVLLTKDWPINIHNFMTESEMKLLRDTGVGIGIGSKAAMKFANLVCPRYHFAGTRGMFFQRTPYKNLQYLNPFTRFVALANISQSKDKLRKWIHALSLEPITFMTDKDLQELPESVTENPYVEILTPLNPFPGDSLNSMGKSASQSLKRPKLDGNNSLNSNSGNNSGNKSSEHHDDSGGSSSTNAPTVNSFFFSTLSKNQLPPKPLLTTPSSDSSRNLFIGGIPPHMSDGQIFDLFPDAINVRHPEGKSFAFLEFRTHQDALRVISSTPVSIRGKPLSVGWGRDKSEGSISSIMKRKLDSDETEGNGENGPTDGHQDTSIAAPPNDTIDTLFLGGVTHLVTDEELYGFFPTCEVIRRLEGKNFVFLQFRSHNDALEVMKRYNGQGKLGWATAPSSRAKGKMAGPVKECWFCLSSPTAKLHLVTSVSDHSYLSLARGGVTDNHVIVSPIECIGRRSQLSPEIKADMDRFEAALEKAFTLNEMELLRVERIMEKTEAHHLHVQFIPIPKQYLSRMKQLFGDLQRQYQIEFQEMQAGLSVDQVLEDRRKEAVTAGEADYLSIQIPSEKEHSPRESFLYTHSEGSRFPMNFGAELAARIINKPDRANWRNCILSTEEEEEKVNQFRTLFEPFDFTLSS